MQSGGGVWSLRWGALICRAAAACGVLPQSHITKPTTHAYKNSIPDWLTHAKILGCDSNVLSVVLIFLCTLVLCFGVKESTKFNAVMTVLNLIVLTFVVIVGTPQVRDENLEDFTPNGLSGVAKGAGLVFFAFLGFDMVSCLSEEVENPQRNMPIGIIGSLVISMIVYVSLSLVICGMADIDLLGTETPISNAFTANACCTPDQQEKDITKACLDCNGGEAINSTLFYGSKIIQFGAMFGLTTACFTCLMGQPRIFYRMAKDGLLFSHFGKINKSNSVPLFGTIFTGFFVSAIAVFIDLEKLAKMISLGTLQVFTFVNAGVIILRTSRPDVNKHYVPSLLVIFVLFVFAGGISVEYWTFCGVWQTSIPTACLIGSGLVAMLIRKAPRANPPNSFKCPMVPIVPLAGVFCNVYMCASMGQKAWEDIGYWLAVGCFIYFTYGMWNSELREKNDILFTNSLDSGYGSRDGESESSSAPLINEDVYRFSGKKKGIII